MKKIQLKQDVVERLDAGRTQQLKGGDTVTGDSGGTNCGTCGACPSRFTCAPTCGGGSIKGTAGPPCGGGPDYENRTMNSCFYGCSK